ncbi:MAG: hypothetical protein J6Y75_07055 [Spirochaetaceae bacterium]|nr:hypothetical protein [Spirochaetaceae bacterium]MBP5329641.1 hypothetical protein [Spirochaetaceae bacterium]
MSSVLSKSAIKKAEKTARMAELKYKIYDPAYLDSAIQRIAQVLSNNLVEDHITQGQMFYGR